MNQPPKKGIDKYIKQISEAIDHHGVLLDGQWWLVLSSKNINAYTKYSPKYVGNILAKASELGLIEIKRLGMGTVCVRPKEYKNEEEDLPGWFGRRSVR